MEDKLKNLRVSMDNTVLQEGTVDARQKRKIYDAAINGNRAGRMNFMKPILSVAVSCVLLIMLGMFVYDQLKTPGQTVEPFEKKEPVGADEDDKKIDAPTAPVDEKVWKDVTVLDPETKYDMPTTAKGYIASAAHHFNQKPEKDSKLIQAGFDEMYYYYLESMGIQNALEIIKVEGISLEKDFNNIKKLTAIIQEEQSKVSDGVNLEGVPKHEYHKHWNPPTERMKEAVSYLQMLLTDLDKTLNGVDLDQFGYSYQGDGRKVEELEKFIKGEELVVQNESTDIPGFVRETDFKQIDWDKTVTKIGSNGNSDIKGNPDKVGYVGPELQAKKIDKWLWHFFGKTEGKLTVVAYHQETSMKEPLLKSGYNTEFAGGALNGADATMPSNITLPVPGKWALLVYIDEKLFDTLVISVKEKVTE